MYLNILLKIIKYKQHHTITLTNYNNRQLLKNVKQLKHMELTFLLQLKKKIAVCILLLYIHNYLPLLINNKQLIINKHKYLTFYNNNNCSKSINIIFFFKLLALYILLKKNIIQKTSNVNLNANITTVLRSPLSDKKSREQFKLQIYKKNMHVNIKYDNTLSYLLFCFNYQQTAIIEKKTINIC